MLTALPVLFLGELTLVLTSLRPSWGWRRSFLRAALVTGSYAILASEALSLVGGVILPVLAAVWAVPLLVGAAWLIITSRERQRPGLPPLALPVAWPDRLLLLGVVLIALATAIVAGLAPPNTWDSLNYHMPRVAHWAQQHSLRHYAAGIEVQNGIGPGAEILVLQTYVLSSGDRWVNFVQWFAMLASLLAASKIAEQLGAKPLGQLLAAVLVATLPMGVAQASSTMTDYVLGAWMLCVASETLTLCQRNADRSVLAFLSLAAGLALSVKPTAFAYLLPFAVLAGAALLRLHGPRRAAAGAAVALAAVLALNGGHWMRNLGTYGNPIGVPDLAGVHGNEIHTPAALVSNLTRHAGMHAFTPWPWVNRQVMRVINKAHQLVGLDLNDPRTTSVGEFTERTPMTEETRATNWFHAWLYGLGFVFLVVGNRRLGRLVLAYGIVVAATFVVFCFVFKWQVFSSRYHLPFFVLYAPLAATMVSGLFPSWLARGLGLAFIFAAWPWLVGLDNRPLLPKAGSDVTVLSSRREDLYFWPGSAGGYDEAAYRIREAGCLSVGLMISGGGAEYPLWEYLGAPRPNLRIEWIVSGTPSARYADPAFQPCAILCDVSCPLEWTMIRGLVLADQFGDLRVFLQPTPGEVP